MRKLITSDVFKMARIIKEAKVKDALAQIFKTTKKTEIKILESDSEEEKKEKTKALEEQRESAGFEAIMTVFEACSTEKLEKMLYEFMGGVCERKAEEIANQTLEETIESIKKIVEENNIGVFFEKASQSVK